MQKYKIQIFRFLITLVIGIIIFNPIYYGLIWKYDVSFTVAIFLGYFGDYSARFVLNKFWATGSKSTVHMVREAVYYFIVCVINASVAVYIKGHANLSLIEKFVLGCIPSIESKRLLHLIGIQIAMIPFTTIMVVALFVVFKRMVKEASTA